MFPPIFQTLKASSAVKAILGSNPPRIYRHGNVPQDTTRPYAVWQLIVGVPENTLSELPAVDRCTVQIDAYHDTANGIELLALAIRDAIEPHAHITSIPVDMREPETLLYRVAIECDWFLSR